MGQKKSRNLSGQKYRATSQDKKYHANSKGKKTRNLLVLNNYALFWDKKLKKNCWDQKIMHHFGTTKKITQPLGQKIKQPLGTKQNHAISWDNKKIMQPLWTNKIMQPLGVKKNHTTSQNNKKYATCWDKKFTQPLGTKKSPNLLGEKNHATYETKKIMQALKTKQKITLSIGQILSKLVHKAPNCSSDY